MSNWNELENRLRLWKPRAPSEKVKTRLFGPAAGGAVAAVDARQHPAWHWLAPAMAVFLFGMFVIGRQPGAMGSGESVLGQFMMSEPDRVSHSANNSVQVIANNSVQVKNLDPNFDSTNGSHSLTTAPPVSWTNQLIQ